MFTPLSIVQQSTVEWICAGGHSSFGLNVSLSLRLRGALSKPALERALGDLMGRHDGLRSRIERVDGRLVQSFAPVAERVALELTVVTSFDEVEARIAQRLEGRLDLERSGPLFVELLQLSADDHVLVWIVSHTATDTHSDDLFMAELLTAYACRARGELPALTAAMTLREHVAAEMAAGAALSAAQLQYWASVLRDCTPAIPGRIREDRDPAAQVPARGRIVSMSLSAATTRRLEAFATASKVSLMAAMCSVIFAAIARRYGLQDVWAFMTHAGRDSRQLKTLGASAGRDFLIRVGLAGADSPAKLAKVVQSALIRSAIASRLPFTHERAVAQLAEQGMPMNAAGASRGDVRGHVHITDALQIRSAVPDLAPGLAVERVMPGPLLREGFSFEPARTDGGAEDAPYAGILNLLLRRDLSPEPGEPITLVAVFLEDGFAEREVREFLASVCRVAELMSDDERVLSRVPTECFQESEGRA